MSDKFVFLNRGHKHDLVLLPGWAFDKRIFNWLELPFNYILPQKPVFPESCHDLLLFFNHQGIEKAWIMGWSMGGLTGWRFAQNYPDRVEQLYLVSVRSRYSKEEIANMKAELKKDKQNSLEYFFRLCFAGSPKLYYDKFKRDMQDNLIKDSREAELIRGLDLLRDYSIEQEIYFPFPVSLCYGARDKLIPSDMRLNFSDIPLKVIKRAGHMPFFYDDFFKWL